MRGLKLAALAALFAMSVTATSCVHTTQIEIFTCPDISDEAIEDLEGAALVWYREHLDPWCESLENAADAS